MFQRTARYFSLQKRQHFLSVHKDAKGIAKIRCALLQLKAEDITVKNGTNLTFLPYKYHSQKWKHACLPGLKSSPGHQRHWQEHWRQHELTAITVRWVGHWCLHKEECWSQRWQWICSSPMKCWGSSRYRKFTVCQNHKGSTILGQRRAKRMAFWISSLTGTVSDVLSFFLFFHYVMR